MEATPISLRGSRRDIGRALGELAQPWIAGLLEQSTSWFALQRWRGHAMLDDMAAAIQLHLPRQWDELCGLAEGLDMPLKDVLLWNARGDLLHQTDDGCTTVAVRNPDGSRWIAHNEDGDPYLYGKCRLVDIQSEDGPGFLSFYVPGSLPGMTFAVNRAGLVQTVDNLRIMRGGKGVPRMMLARAVLDCASLDDAQALLRSLPRAGGFHHLLGAVGDERLLSIEATPDRCAILPVNQVYWHTNHCIHFGAKQTTQLVTTSSRERLERLDVLMLELPEAAAADDLLTVLHDTDATLPLLRTDLRDPDGENTLATALFHLDDSLCKLLVYDRSRTPVFEHQA